MNQAIRDKWDERIAFICEHFELLTEWEQDFMLSISETRDLGFDLKPKPVGKLYQIYNEVDQKLG